MNVLRKSLANTREGIKQGFTRHADVVKPKFAVVNCTHDKNIDKVMESTKRVTNWKIRKIASGTAAFAQHLYVYTNERQPPLQPILWPMSSMRTPLQGEWSRLRMRIKNPAECAMPEPVVKDCGLCVCVCV